MTEQNKQEPPTFDPLERYKTALELYVQELRTLGTKTTVFLVVQSILVAAFADTLIREDSHYVGISFGISIIGIVYSGIHFLSGQHSSSICLRWMAYMRSIESYQTDTPWNWFLNRCQHRCTDSGIKGFWMRLNCERCLWDKVIWPAAWITSPTLITLGWTGIVIWLFWRLNWTVAFLLTITIIFPAIIYIIIRASKIWWGGRVSTEKDNGLTPGN